MRIVFLGTPDYSVESLRAIHSAGHEIPLVVTQPDRSAGRGMAPAQPPVKRLAVQLGIPVLQPENPNTPETLDAVLSARSDVLCVIAYGCILNSSLLRAPKLFPLNAHGSILPRWRGASPIQAAIRAGDAETGVTIVKMARKLDAGDVAFVKKILIAPNETCGTLHDKLMRLSAEAFVEALKKAEHGELKFSPQNESQSTMTRKLTRKDGAIDFSQTSVEIERMVRAYQQWPGTHGKIEIHGKTVELKIVTVSLTAAPNPEMAKRRNWETSPGHAVVAESKLGLWVATSDGTIELVTVQCPGKKPCSAKSFLMGLLNR